MRKLFQKEWHHIPFDSFAATSSSRIADLDFYSRFYRKFFETYGSPADIDPAWTALKEQAVSFLRDHEALFREQPLLSIGCGLGLIEKGLIDSGFSHIEVTEVSMDPLRWLVPHLASEKIHVGPFPGCLPRGRLYPFIYLSNVEYFLSRAELKGLLEKVRERLMPQGVCMVLTSACESVASGQAAWESLKDGVKAVLDWVGVRDRGQLWGYRRTPGEFLAAMRGAGFSRIADGFLEKKTPWDTYWIEGRNEHP